MVALEIHVDDSQVIDEVGTYSDLAAMLRLVADVKPRGLLSATKSNTLDIDDVTTVDQIEALTGTRLVYWKK